MIRFSFIITRFFGTAATAQISPDPSQRYQTGNFRLEESTGKKWQDSGLKGWAYLEDENGESISVQAAKTCQESLTKIPRHRNCTWMKPFPAHQKYREQTEQYFPILRLCDDHWKVERIAIDNHPSWRSHAQSNINTSETLIVKDEMIICLVYTSGK